MPKSEVKKTPRNETIDLLRGLSILVMIFIHTSAYFLSNPFVKSLWNISQFVVVTFIFCSGYIYFQKSQMTMKTFFSLPYVVKRITRLFVPYYIFLLFYIPLVAFTDREKLSFDYIVRSLTVMGGVDLSWLVLLFSYVMILLPFLDFFAKKSRKLFYIYFFLSLLSSIYLLFFKSPVYYRYIMWLPWSLVLYFAWYVAKYEKSGTKMLQLFIYSLAVYIIATYLLQLQGKSLIHFENKYPPNVFHISYGIFMTMILYVSLDAFGVIFAAIRRFINFLSIHSYHIFFIHFFVLFAIDSFFKAASFNWISLFLIVTASTVIVQMGIIRLQNSRLFISSQH